MWPFSRKPAQVGDQIKTVLESLCSLEINTIVKDNMTGQKMPAPERALLQLAEDYDRRLARHGAPRLAAGPLTGGPAEYARLNDRAAKLTARWNADPSLTDDQQAELMIVCRIRDTAEQIVRIFEAAAARGQAIGDHAADAIAAHPIELTADEIVTLHKAWDLGLEQIVLQTVIHLDGDVMHRVLPRYAAGTTATPLLSAHDAAIRTSITYWKTLVEIVGEFLGGVARALGQRG